MRRASEIISLRWSDILWSDGQIRISKRWAKAEDGETKTAASNGYVPMHPILAEYLKEWREQSPYSKVENFVFPSLVKNGKVPMCASIFVAGSSAVSAVNAGVVLVKGQRFGLHNLRHSLSAWLVNKGKSIRRRFRACCGIAIIRTTMNLYTQDDHDEKAGGMHRLYEKAMLWEIVEWQRNPMQLVEIKGISKRKKKPVVLTVEQYYLILALIPHPYRTMVMVAQCTGLRAEEVLALEWEDIDFENLSMRVVRAVVHGRVKMVKTEYSEDELPLDPEFATVLLDWKLESEREAGAEDSTPSMGLNLVFRSHVTWRHYHTAPIQQDYIRPAGCCLVECPKCGAGVGVWCRQDSPVPNGKRLPLHEERWEAAGKYDGIGWHTFRHTYRSWLDDTGAPVGVQQKLMRHAQISTTMNVYGNALMEAKREANTKVVRKALRST